MSFALSNYRSHCKGIGFLSYVLLAFVFAQVLSPHLHISHTHFDSSPATSTHEHSGQTHSSLAQDSDEHHGAGLEVDTVGPIVLKNVKALGDTLAILVAFLIILLPVQFYVQRGALYSVVPPFTPRDRAIRPPLRAPPH